jgi:geranylgeranyl reductase family protein
VEHFAEVFSFDHGLPEFEGLADDRIALEPRSRDPGRLGQEWRRVQTSVEAYDVAVVGAGPAGAAAALGLARSGAGVVLLERDTWPRYKTCGGGVVGRALQLWGADAAPQFDVACHAVELRLLDAGLCFEVQRATPVFHTSMRAEFDAALVAAAIRAGARLQAGCAVLDLAADAAGVTLRTTTGTVRARFVIGADGAASRIAVHAGWDEIRHRAPALEWEVQVEPQDLRRFAAAPRFDFDAVPGGYGWVFPKRDHLSVGVVRVAARPAQLPILLAAYLERIGLHRIQHADKHGAWVPLRPRAGGASRGRVLLVGDAAGFADPLLCEGISYAIQSGQLAARALIEGRFVPVDSRRAYEAALRRDILPQLQWGRRLATMMYGHDKWRTALFRRAGAQCCDAMVDVIAGRNSYAAWLASPARLARLRRAGSVDLRSRPAGGANSPPVAAVVTEM